MKQFIKDIDKNAKLYRDDKSGIAWIEDGTTGNTVTVHSNISSTGSVLGMKKLGYWRKSDRTVKTQGWIYNIDTFVCDENNKLEMIVVNECRCNACMERKLNIAQ